MPQVGGLERSLYKQWPPKGLTVEPGGLFSCGLPKHSHPAQKKMARLVTTPALDKFWPSP